VERVTVEIAARRHALLEVEDLLGKDRLYRKGTNPEWYANLPRDVADLQVVHLNLIPGVRARIVGLSAR
jgi:hypothetical protein